MGHYVEYLIDVPADRARDWLSSQSGSWLESETTAAIPHGEFDFDRLSVNVELHPAACHLSIPQIKYSWLIDNHCQSVELITQFELEVCQMLPEVDKVRIDELLWLVWQSQTGRTWDEWPNPTRQLKSWILSTSQDAAHFRIMPATTRTD